MPKIRLDNDDEKILGIWLEPWGEDYWMNPKEQFTIVADAPEGEASDAAPFDVVFHDQGVSIVVNCGYEPVVYDQSGSALDCGHQRPIEVLRAWTEAAEAAAQRTADSPILREMTREHAESMRQEMTPAEAVEQGHECPPSP